MMIAATLIGIALFAAGFSAGTLLTLFWVGRTSPDPLQPDLPSPSEPAPSGPHIVSMPKDGWDIQSPDGLSWYYAFTGEFIPYNTKTDFCGAYDYYESAEHDLPFAQHDWSRRTT